MSVPQPKITRLPAHDGPRIGSVAAAPSLANNARLATCLGLVCNMLPSVTAGLVKCVAAGDGGNDGCATWPPGTGIDSDVATLCERLQAGVEPQVMVQAPDASTVLLGRRLVHNTHTEALLVLKLAAPSDTQRETLFKLIDWSAAWLQLVLASEHDHAHTARLELLAAALDASDLREAATAITIRVTTLAGADSASIGLLRGEGVELLARSHTANFDPTTSSNRTLTAAMAEALDERGVVAAPPLTPAVCVASFAHDQLCRHENASAVCSLPRGWRLRHFDGDARPRHAAPYASYHFDLRRSMLKPNSLRCRSGPPTSSVNQSTRVNLRYACAIPCAPRLTRTGSH